MPNLKEVRTRIESVNSTRQITNAMKMVAASKLRKAQNAILQLRPYANKLNEILTNISASIEESDLSIFTQEKKVNNILIIPVASNKGLCGTFNANVIKHTVNRIQNHYQKEKEQGRIHIMGIGRYVSEYFSKRDYLVAETHDDLFNKLSFENVALLAEKLMEAYAKGTYDKIEIIYNQFKNAAVQKLVTEQYLPVISDQEEVQDHKQDFIFEPGKEEIITELIPKSLKITLFKALLDSYASEHGARMTAMHQATDNATELLKDLKLSYNKARQAAITNELIEIVSGANALKS